MSARTEAGGVIRRAGTTLIELLVSLPIALLIATAATMLLVRLGHTTRGQSSALGSTRELRHGVQILSADLETASGSQVAVVSDTLLAFRSQLGVVRLCEVRPPRSLVVSAHTESTDLWLAAVRAGDVIRMWRASEPAAAPLPVEGVVADVPTAMPSASCGVDDASSVYRRWRVTVGDSLPLLAAGTPVSLHRDVRYRHYRSGGAWWLGRQSRDGTTWETIQPVVGPLRSASAGGVTMEARRATGGLVSINTSTPDSLRAEIVSVAVLLSMDRRTPFRGGRHVDSAAFIVPLRADAYRRHR